MNECVRPRKKLALHSGRSFAPNAGSSASNKRHLYSGPSCSSCKCPSCKNRGAPLAPCPQPTISQNRGGGELGGGSHTRTGPGRPPPPPPGSTTHWPIPQLAPPPLHHL